MKIDGQDQRRRSHSRSVSPDRCGFVRRSRATGFTESVGRAETPGCHASRRRRPQLDGKIRSGRSPSLIRSAINFHLIPINRAAAVSTVDAGQQLLRPARRECASRDACHDTLCLSVARRFLRRIFDTKLHENWLLSNALRKFYQASVSNTSSVTKLQPLGYIGSKLKTEIKDNTDNTHSNGALSVDQTLMISTTHVRFYRATLLQSVVCATVLFVTFVYCYKTAKILTNKLSPRSCLFMTLNVIVCSFKVKRNQGRILMKCIFVLFNVCCLMMK